MLRPISRADHPEVALLLRAIEPDTPDLAMWEASWSSCSSGHDEHMLGHWIRGELRCAIRITAHRRPRLRHLGLVELACPRDVDPTELLRAANDLVDSWTPLDRLQFVLPAEHPALPSAVEQGYVGEVRHRARMPDGRDQVALGRIRPGFSPRPPGGPPAWPDRTRRPPTSVILRRADESDVPEIASLSVEPTNVWGTLQVASSNHEYYLERHRRTPSDHQLYVIVADGEVAGLGGVHPSGVPGVVGIGMGIAVDWQGCGLGRQLLDHLCASARASGARRTELGVWEDNVRARRLYESAGFVAEGIRRFDGIRAGGYASSMDMAILHEPRPGGSR